MRLGLLLLSFSNPTYEKAMAVSSSVGEMEKGKGVRSGACLCAFSAFNSHASYCHVDVRSEM